MCTILEYNFTSKYNVVGARPIWSTPRAKSRYKSTPVGVQRRLGAEINDYNVHSKVAVVVVVADVAVAVARRPAAIYHARILRLDTVSIPISGQSPSFIDLQQ